MALLKTVAGALCMLVACQSPPVERTGLLRYDFVKGAEWILLVRSSSRLSSPGKEEPHYEEKVSAEIGMSVMDARRDGALLGMTLRRLCVETMGILGDVRFDSAEEGSRPPASYRTLADDVGSQVIVTADRRGLWRPESEGEGVRQETLDFIVRLLELPERPADLGDTWVIRRTRLSEGVSFEIMASLEARDESVVALKHLGSHEARVSADQAISDYVANYQVSLMNGRCLSGREFARIVFGAGLLDSQIIDMTVELESVEVVGGSGLE